MMPNNTLQDIERGPGAARPAATAGVLAALSIPMLMSSLDTSIANVALPTLARDFAATFPQVQWVVLAYLVTLTSLVVGAGRLGDLLGHRRMMLAGIAVFTLASAACGAATTLAMLVAARAAQGLGASTMMALSLAFVGDAIPKQATGRTMGLLGTMSAIGTALGPSLGGLLISATGWRAVFLVNVPIGVASLLLVRFFLPADRPLPTSVRGGFDYTGTLLLAATVASYSFAMTPSRTHAGPFMAGLLLAALIGAVAFVAVESRAAFPLVRLGMLRALSLGASLLMSVLVSAVVMSTLVVGPFYLAHALGLGAAVVGLLLSVGPAVVALSGVPAGRAVDRLGARRVTLAGLAAMAGGSLALSLLPASLGIAGYVLPIVILTAGYALFQTANNTAVMTGLPAAERGVVSGMLSLARNLGLVTGASVMGTVFALASRASDIGAASPAAVAFGMRATFATAVILMVAALAIAMRNRDRAARPEPAACDTRVRARTTPPHGPPGEPRPSEHTVRDTSVVHRAHPTGGNQP